MDAEDAIEAEGLSAESVESKSVESESVEPGSAESQPGDVAGSGAAAVVARSDEFEGLVVPELEATGHAEVDVAIERLRELGERPTGAHPDLYDGVHQRLQDVLAQIDQQDAGR